MGTTLINPDSNGKSRKKDRVSVSILTFYARETRSKATPALLQHLLSLILFSRSLFINTFVKSLYTPTKQGINSIRVFLYRILIITGLGAKNELKLIEYKNTNIEVQ